jgi:protein-tyrosine phosphatase
MIDFHNHVIPNIDDGSSSLQMSLDMLAKASREGTSIVVNTVHYNHPQMLHLDTDFNYIQTQCNALQKELYNANIKIKIIPHAEVYYTEDLLEASKNPLTLIANKYMLIEFYPVLLPISYEENFYQLQTDGITPIIAHVERYRSVQMDTEIVKRWIEKNYIIQINCESILGAAGRKIQTTSIELLEKGYCHIIGSDAHNNSSRNFCLKDALNVIENKYGSRNKNIVLENLENIIHGKDLDLMSSTKKSSFFKKLFL